MVDNSLKLLAFRCRRATQRYRDVRAGVLRVRV